MVHFKTECVMGLVPANSGQTKCLLTLAGSCNFYVISHSTLEILMMMLGRYGRFRSVLQNYIHTILKHFSFPAQAFLYSIYLNYLTPFTTTSYSSSVNKGKTAISAS